MGYYAVIGGGDGEPLASLTGWTDFKFWADSLPVEGNEEILHLATFGWSQNLRTLAGQLARAEPTGTVASTAANLLRLLRIAPPDASSLFVSDGMAHDFPAD